MVDEQRRETMKKAMGLERERIAVDIFGGKRDWKWKVNV